MRTGVLDDNVNDFMRPADKATLGDISSVSGRHGRMGTVLFEVSMLRGNRYLTTVYSKPAGPEPSPMHLSYNQPRWT